MHSRRRPFSLACCRATTLAVALLLACWPATAQEATPEPGPEPAGLRIRNTAGLSFLYPLTPGTLSPGVPGFRLSHAWGVNPSFAIEGSLLQLGGDAAILQGGGMGVRFTRTLGAVRFRPAVELVVGRAIIDEGGFFVDDGAGSVVYRPFRRPSRIPAVGAGVTGSAEWFHHSGWGAELILGYWRLALPVPSGALMVGVGLRRGSPDGTWYWRTSGKDQEPPRFGVASPDPRPDGIRALGSDGLSLFAADRSGIASIEVDGIPSELKPAPQGTAEAGTGEVRMIASVRPPIHRGTHPLEIEVSDGAGNRQTRIVWVSGSAPVPASTVITTPAGGAAIGTVHAEVGGFVGSATPDLRVVVNGCTAETVRSDVFGEAGHAFKLRVPLQPGPNRVAVETVDPLRGRTVVHHDLMHVTGTTPKAPEALPDLTSWLTASTGAVRVQGTARDAGGVGIREVRVAGTPAALRYMSGTRLDTEFLAYVTPPADGPVEVATTTFDGRVSSRLIPPPASHSPKARGAALLIGIEEYAADRITGPAGAAAIAGSMADLLRERAAFDLPEERVRVLTNDAATLKAVREAIRWLAATAPAVDVVFLYVAGRGVVSAAGEAVGIVPHDTRATYGAGAIRWAEIEELLGSTAGELVVVAELADGEGRAAPPRLHPVCGVGSVWPGGRAVLAATGMADGTFSRRALNALSGTGIPGSLSVRLADLVRSLGGPEHLEPVLRTPGPVFDQALELTVPREN